MTTFLLPGVLGALSIAATWIVLFLFGAGVGLAVHGAVLPRPEKLSGLSLVAAFWTGTAVTILFLQLWHLAFPITAAAFVPLIVFSVAGFVRDRRGALSGWTSLDRRALGGVTVLLALAVLWAAHRATSEVAAFDTYMYHVPVVEWLRQHAIVPGLGNLHDRFAFNNTSFLYAALIESGPWKAGSTHLVNGVFAFALLVHIAMRVRSLTAGKPAAPAVFDLVLLAPVLALVAYPPMFAGLAQDVPAALSMFAGFSLLFGATHGAPREPAERAAACVAGLCALTLGATFKLSVAAAAIPAWGVGAFLVWRAVSVESVLARRVLWSSVVLAIALGGVWLARSYLLSGYAAYPSTFGGLPVDWRVPPEAAHASYDWIGLFARYEQDATAYNGHAWLEFVCNPRAWVLPWLNGLRNGLRLWQLPVPLLLTVLFTLLAVPQWRRRRESRVPWLFAIPLLSGMAAWWHIAPRPLFGFWAFWLLAAVAAAGAVALLPDGRTTLRGGIALALCVMAMPLLGAGLIAARQSDESNLRAAASVWYVVPDPTSWLQPTRWEFPTERYTTTSGLELLVPRGHRCGRAPLPCTSHPAADLELREPGNLDSGFRVNGEWQAERWPNPWTEFLADWQSAPRCGRADPDQGER